MIIRPIRKNELMLLTEFWYDAIFQRDGKNLAPSVVIQEPSLWIYIDEFGTQKDDHCFVAEVEGKIVGAVTLYQQVGFDIYTKTEEEYIMVCTLA